ncbi:hypothetical protein L4C34_20075 [Vibrio profundum]|uniref:hypothetical protein n=1 Tax=Vibrio profundum TaxID=2910247 RepID=UPI003D0D3806
MLSSSDGNKKPWVYLLDGREWVGASLDAWETNNDLMIWFAENNCVLCAFVYSGKGQAFAVEKGIEDNRVR